jgi:hypothetical protein
VENGKAELIWVSSFQGNQKFGLKNRVSLSHLYILT